MAVTAEDLRAAKKLWESVKPTLMDISIHLSTAEERKLCYNMQEELDVDLFILPRKYDVPIEYFQSKGSAWGLTIYLPSMKRS